MAEILKQQNERINLEIEKSKRKLIALEDLKRKIENKLITTCKHIWVKDTTYSYDDLACTACSLCGISYHQFQYGR